LDLCVEEKGQNNLAFATLFQLGDTKSCVDLLVKTKRTPEAAMFARTYAPRSVSLVCQNRDLMKLMKYSLVPGIVDEWKSDLKAKGKPKLAARIAAPADQPELFEEKWEQALEKERSGSADEVLVDV
jgi:coatomer subunit beta'